MRKEEKQGKIRIKKRGDQCSTGEGGEGKGTCSTNYNIALMITEKYNGHCT